MPGRFIDVLVEEHDELPDGCKVRFEAAAGGGVAASVSTDGPIVRYAPPLGAPGLFRVEARSPDDRPSPARVALVRIPGAGTALLIWGGERGLRLFRATLPGAGTSGLPVTPAGHGAQAGPERPLAEPYLLLPPAAVTA